MTNPDAFNPQKQLKRFPLLVVVPGCIFCLFAFLFHFTAFAKKEPTIDEISVFLNVSGLGGIELEALIQDEKVYLPVTDLFDYLKIKNKLSSKLDSVSGFFLSENNTYVIDKTKNQIILQNQIYTLKPDDLIQTLTGLYLRSTIFGKVFGLDCIFNFRSLSINLSTKLDLPVIRAKRQEMMRQNISKLKREIIADTIIKRKYPAFSFGAADWAVTSTQQEQNVQNTMLNLSLGAIVAGGETNISINYNTQQAFNLKQQNYFWRYANNDNKTLRQVIAGKIPLRSTASLFAPVVGLQFTNSPTTFRRSFGTYTLSDIIEPEWMVELYINNVLVDFVKADASGFFAFRVPMVYGNSTLQLRFLGPAGEERIKEQNVNVPYNFLPKNEMEYTWSAGVLEDGKQSRFSRLDVKYGLSHSITIGSGVEYLSSVITGPVMPFINASFKVASDLFLSADYTYNVLARAIMNYRTSSDFLLELNYTRYKEGQQAIYNNYLEERRAIISQQFRGRNFSAFSRFTINQIVYPNGNQTVADVLFSGSWQGISSNLTTYGLFINQGYLNVYSNLSLALRLPYRYVLRPQVQYGYRNERINSIRMEVEKQLFGRGYLNLTYDNNFNYYLQSFSLGLRFDLSFIRASFSARQTNNRTFFTQSLSGGSVYDGKTNYLKLNNRNNVGRGGLVISPYLDINSNGRRDAHEPKIMGLKLKINGGRIQNNIRDTTIQIFDLEPYTSYLLEINRNSFDNITWHLKNATLKVAIDPNKLKLIGVPVNVSGEASGMVYGTNADSTGQGRIIINFYRNGSTLVGHTLTESDGYFSFLGLPPGSYTASVDRVQLGKLKMIAFPASKPFKIAASADGDVASNIEFKLQLLADRTVGRGLKSH